jgi:hypothetical protein
MKATAELVRYAIQHHLSHRLKKFALQQNSSFETLRGLFGCVAEPPVVNVRNMQTIISIQGNRAVNIGLLNDLCPLAPERLFGL